MQRSARSVEHPLRLLHRGFPSPVTPTKPDQAQYERAHQSWELIVLDPPEPNVLALLRKAVRTKRSDLPKLKACLPGVIRRGARVDLEPIEAQLREAGLRCELRRTPD